MLVRVFTGVVLVPLVLVASLAIAATATAADPPTGRSSLPLIGPALALAGPTDDTINEFLPEERGLGECISAVQRPGCGSEARGGWRQGLVLLAIIGGLSIIAWRVVAGSRRARREAPALSDDRTPDATNARDGSRDGRGP